MIKLMITPAIPIPGSISIMVPIMVIVSMPVFRRAIIPAPITVVFDFTSGCKEQSGQAE
jgi:hypothetical protein